MLDFSRKRCKTQRRVLPSPRVAAAKTGTVPRLFSSGSSVPPNPEKEPSFWGGTTIWHVSRWPSTTDPLGRSCDGGRRFPQREQGVGARGAWLCFVPGLLARRQLEYPALLTAVLSWPPWLCRVYPRSSCGKVPGLNPGPFVKALERTRYLRQKDPGERGVPSLPAFPLCQGTQRGHQHRGCP